ncbi:hypothetical protein N7528_010077 [Penicillium herquei]|nr:hypothetical protein N7528_010077 [Penicillium herquei]
MTENLQDFWYRPQARVHIASSKAALCERINQKHTSSPQLSCIRSIEAKWCLAEYDEPIRPNSAASYPAQLRDIIIRCKNLQSLTLVCTGEFRLRRRDVSPYMERKEGEAMRNYRDRVTLKEGDILPDVKNVQFRNMRFGPIQSELWATHLQWQNIKHLSLIQVYWTHLLPKITVKGFFHALEGLEMSVPNPMYPDRNRPAQIECINQFHNFLKELPPLKRFIGYGFPQDTLAVLAEYHSNSLAHLRFRCHLNSGTGIHGSYGEDRPFRASINNLDSLLCQFPNLHSLGLNVDWAPDEKLKQSHTIYLPKLSCKLISNILNFTYHTSVVIELGPGLTQTPT